MLSALETSLQCLQSLMMLSSNNNTHNNDGITLPGKLKDMRRGRVPVSEDRGSGGLFVWTDGRLVDGRMEGRRRWRGGEGTAVDGLLAHNSYVCKCSTYAPRPIARSIVVDQPRSLLAVSAPFLAAAFLAAAHGLSRF